MLKNTLLSLPSKGVATVSEIAALPRGAVRVRRDDRDCHRHRGLEEVHHLLVGERAHRVLADLHQAAALPQTSLPGVTEVLNLCQKNNRPFN